MADKVKDPNSIPFSIVVSFLERVSAAKAIKKKELFQAFIGRFTPGTEYPVLRLVFPEADSSRGAYGLKEHTIGRIFSELLLLPSSEKDRVLRWKDPSLQAKHNCTVGDFPSVLLSAIELRMPKTRSATLTVGEVNQLLDELYVAIEPEKRKDLFQDMISRAPPREIRWLIKIILKDMKLGIGVEGILRHLHPDAVQLYHMSSSLKHVLETIAKPTDQASGETAQDSIYFKPFKPMLSERVNPGDVPERFGSLFGSIYLEPKLDGERMMIHVDKRSQRVTIFSRNGINFTKKYGDHQLSPLILKAFKGNGAVFDGELVSWDPARQRIHPFGLNREIGKSATSSIPDTQDRDASQDLLGVSEDGNLFYIIFDLVFYVDIDNNEFDLRNTELQSRRELLERILMPIEHRVEMIQNKLVAEPTVDDIKVYLKEALDAKKEGIMVKRTNSYYKLNIRGRGWYKIKADYDETFTDTLDLVVLGGYFSDTTSHVDHTANPIDAVTSFLVGVPKSSHDGKTEFKTVTKVSTGLTRAQLVFVRNQLRSTIVNVAPGTLPAWFGDWKPVKADRPDVYFDPFIHEASVVLEVNAGEILQSGLFTSGYQLRFPRIVRPRADKDWTDATTLDDLRTMATVDRDSDRMFIQNLSRFEKGQRPPTSPHEPKKRKREIVIIDPGVPESAKHTRSETQDTFRRPSDDE